MAIQEEIIDTETPDGPMAVVHKQPVGGSERRVLIFMDAPGVRPSLHDFAARLAVAGYDVALPDLWHRHGRLIGYEPADIAADPSRRAHIGEMLASLDDDEVQMDRDTTLAALGWTDGTVGTIGFCLGARYVHKAMQERPAQFVVGAMWHPSFLTDDSESSPHLSVDQIGELWIGIGDADQVQSIEMHQRYFDAVESMDHVEVEIFDGADHGFTWPGYSMYDQEVSDTCFAATVELFGAESLLQADQPDTWNLRQWFKETQRHGTLLVGMEVRAALPCDADAKTRLFLQPLLPG